MAFVASPLSYLVALLALGGCKKDGDSTDEARPPVDPGALPSGDTGSTTTDPPPSPVGGTVQIIPWIDDVPPMQPAYREAPPWFSTFDGLDWTVHELGDTPTPIEVTVDASSGGRFAVAWACAFNGAARVGVFLGTPADGNALLIDGCRATPETVRVDSSATVDPSVYGDRPEGNGRCAQFRFGGQTWFATCNRVTTHRFQTVVGRPTFLYGQRLTDPGTVDRVLVDGPFDIGPAGQPVRLAFDDNRSAAPEVVSVAVTGIDETPSVSLITDVETLSVVHDPPSNDVPVVPTALAPEGSVYRARLQVQDAETLTTQIEELFFDDPLGAVAMGDAFDDEPPSLTFAPGQDGWASVTLSAPEDWSLASVFAFPNEAGAAATWEIHVTRGFLGDTETFAIPDPAELQGLADWIGTVQDGFGLPELAVPNPGQWSMAVRSSRGAGVSPFDVWRARSYADHLPDGARLVVADQRGDLP